MKVLTADAALSVCKQQLIRRIVGLLRAFIGECGHKFHIPISNSSSVSCFDECLTRRTLGVQKLCFHSYVQN